MVGGRAIAERQLELLRGGCALARVRGRERSGAVGAAGRSQVVPDRVAAAGAAGRRSRRARRAADDCDAVVCVAGDLPFVAPALLAALRDRAPAADAVAPRSAGGIEPLCARYARALLPGRRGAAARRASWRSHELLEQGGGRLDRRSGELAALDPDGRSFFNLEHARRPRARRRDGRRDAGRGP